MDVRLVFCRRLLLVCAVVFMAVGSAVVLGVIPPVKTAAFLGVISERAAPAFWVSAGLNLLAAVTLLSVALGSKGRSWISTSGLVVVGLVALLLGLALADAALAFQAEGPAMRTAAILLWLCAAGDSLAGALAVVAAILRPKKV